MIRVDSHHVVATVNGRRRLVYAPIVKPASNKAAA